LGRTPTKSGSSWSASASTNRWIMPHGRSHAVHVQMASAVVSFRQICSYVKALRRFLTNDALVLAQNKRKREMRIANRVRRGALADESPILDAFEVFDKLCLGGRVPKRWPTSTAELAGLGRMVSHLAPSMSESIQAHQRDKLLSCVGQFWPARHEWATAQHFHDHGFLLDWCEVSCAGPEFWARKSTVSFGVECKRFGNGITEMLGDTESANLASVVMDVADALDMCGTVWLSVLKSKLSDQVIWRRSLQDAFRASASGTWTFGDELIVKWELTSSSGEGQSVQSLLSLMGTKTDDERSYLSGRIRNSLHVDPLLICVRGPRRTGQMLYDYLLDKLDRELKRKFPRGDAAVLVVEWSKIDEMRVFEESAGVRQLVDELMDRNRNLAALIHCSRPLLEEQAEGVNTHSNALFVRSSVTNFPEVASLIPN
jgi:hypothetical protein